LSITFPKDYKFIFTNIFGDTSQVKILEFFIFTIDQSKNPPWTHITQISRILKISKSSIKKVIDEFIKKEVLIEKKIETHAKNPKRDVRINHENQIVLEILTLYKKLKSLSK
jgi:hypothetical protein